ncbi:MAG: 50S ribosomal protein L28 [Candidatus Shikimatogenerans bostrichidophilus]|nr:MAG: 50S ribosomal protein L28 [Candidatus Shikimatogenerans bostrichidophilus]
MSKICEITNKKSISGYRKSHSNIKTKRWFKINFLKKKFYDQINKKWIKLKICSYTIRLIKKKGLNNILNIKKNGKIKK